MDSAPCLQPVADSGLSLSYTWAVNFITDTASTLASNTSPQRNGKPAYFISFGGHSYGTGSWTSMFSSNNQAQQFASNCVALVKAIERDTNYTAYIGIDLDIELQYAPESVPFTSYGAFHTAFRQGAPFDKYPLMLCTLSGIVQEGNDDHYKVDLLQTYGPKQSGFNFVNMMVDNDKMSCHDMSAFWRNETLSTYLPPQNRVVSIWGLNNDVWIIDEPGCNNDLYPWVRTNAVNVGLWQWWLGDPSPVNNVMNQMRMSQ